MFVKENPDRKKKKKRKKNNVILEEQNDIAYSPSIHNDWLKDVMRMVHQHLIFFELSNEDTPRFSQDVAPNQRLGCEKIRGLLLLWRLALPMFKKNVRGTDVEERLKHPICLQYVNLLKWVNFFNHSFQICQEHQKLSFHVYTNFDKNLWSMKYCKK